MLQRILEFLSGKKTYIMAGIYGIDAVGSSLGWWSPDQSRTVIEQIATLIALRAGVTKSAVPVEK